MGKEQLKIDYDEAQEVKTAFDLAQDDLEANAGTMPSSGKYGEGETYITFAAVRDGVDAISGVDSDTAANIRKLAKEIPDD